MSSELKEPFYLEMILDIIRSSDVPAFMGEDFYNKVDIAYANGDKNFFLWEVDESERFCESEIKRLVDEQIITESFAEKLIQINSYDADYSRNYINNQEKFKEG